MPATTPTTVELGDGSSYEIPAGVPGSYTWVRQASLVANAYHDGGDDAQAYAWTREYNKRRQIWDQAQAGADLASLINANSVDLLAPFRIVYDLAAGIVRTVGAAADATIKAANWVPWLVGGVIVIAGIGLAKGTLRARV